MGGGSDDAELNAKISDFTNEKNKFPPRSVSYVLKDHWKVLKNIRTCLDCVEDFGWRCSMMYVDL